MSSRVPLIALALCVGAQSLVAQRQGHPDPAGTALLARAESLLVLTQRADSATRAESYARRRGHVVRASRLVIVFRETVTPETGQRLASRADSIVEAFGGGLAAWLDSVVGIELGISDTGRVLAAPLLRHRSPIALTESGRPQDSIEGAQRMAQELARRYRSGLDPAWVQWLPWDYGVVWVPKTHGELALLTLVRPSWSTGAGCLAGRLSECRMWLGLDATSRPEATRYRANDLREAVRQAHWIRGLDEDRTSCVGGDDAACVRVAEQRHIVPTVPAGGMGQAAMVRAVWALHGPDAVRRAFRDTRGGIGERFARAAGISEDSLVAEWRSWTLSRGRGGTLSATLPQALAVIFAALFVVFLAARSGRWR